MKETLLYKMTYESIEILEVINLYSGVVYYVKTDENGMIIDIEDAEFKDHMNYMDNQ